jgi:hypothetical protein
MNWDGISRESRTASASRRQYATVATKGKKNALKLLLLELDVVLIRCALLAPKTSGSVTLDGACCSVSADFTGSLEALAMQCSYLRLN